MQPKVSILIPCYNAQQWIGQAIESALNQTYPHKEVIVVDDGSTDNSLAIIGHFGDQVSWETGPNRGGNIARNRLLALSSGEWLQYLDADDYLLPYKIAEQVKCLQDCPETDILYGPSIFEQHWDNHVKQEVTSIPEPHDPWILLARWYLPQTGSPLWRKQAIIDVGGWKPEQPRCQEHELYLRLLIANKNFQYCACPGSVYRHWSTSTVSKKNLAATYRMRLEIVDKLEDHLAECGELFQERQNAINQARFECARIIWLTDKKWARQIIKKIYLQDRGFVPTGVATPKSYRRIFKLLGFSVTEYIAGFRRNLVALPHINSLR